MLISTVTEQQDHTSERIKPTDASSEEILGRRNQSWLIKQAFVTFL